MPITEAARHDLYNGLTELLGLDRADTLMAYLPEFDPSDIATKADIAELRAATKADIAASRVATKSDIAELKSDIPRLDSDIGDVRLEIKELRSEMRAGFAGVNERFDRMYVTLVAGLFVIVAAMAGVFFTTI